MRKLNKLTQSVLMTLVLILAQGCQYMGGAMDSLNPYGDEPIPEGWGERTNKHILEDTGGEGSSDDRARHALEVMGSYQRTQAPQPTYPVIRPAEVRLMWVPDHLNKGGDLVPAHYYYLKVKDDDWAVQDAFEIEEQLNKSTPGSSGTPWVYK